MDGEGAFTDSGANRWARGCSAMHNCCAGESPIHGRARSPAGLRHAALLGCEVHNKHCGEPRLEADPPGSHHRTDFPVLLRPDSGWRRATRSAPRANHRHQRRSVYRGIATFTGSSPPAPGLLSRGQEVGWRRQGLRRRPLVGGQHPGGGPMALQALSLPTGEESFQGPLGSSWSGGWPLRLASWLSFFAPSLSGSLRLTHHLKAPSASLLGIHKIVGRLVGLRRHVRIAFKASRPGDAAGGDMSSQLASRLEGVTPLVDCPCCWMIRLG